MIGRFIEDLQASARGVRRHPTLVTGAILTLGCAAGINAGMAGLVDRALLSPPASVRNAERVATLTFAVSEGDAEAPAPSMSTTSFAAYRRLAGVEAFERTAAFSRRSAVGFVNGEQVELESTLVTAGYFETLGITPRRGRTFDVSDDVAGASPVAIVSDGFWRAQLGGDEAVLGRRIRVDAVDYTIVGVLSRGVTGHTSADGDVWIPIAVSMSGNPQWDQQPYLNSVGILVRLREGVTREVAAQLSGNALDRRIGVQPIAGIGARPADARVAWSLFGVSALILVAGFANAATLLVVRGSRSRHQVQVRRALGAPESVLARQAVLESLLIMIVGAGLALLLATVVEDKLGRVIFPTLAPSGRYSSLVLVALGASSGIGVVVAALATMSQVRLGRPTVLAPAHAQAWRRSFATRGLLLAQTTFSVVLLVGAFLFGTSLSRLRDQDFGMNVERAVVVDFEPGPMQTATNELFVRGIERVRALPGVELATIIDALPFNGFNVPPITVPGRAEPPGAGIQLPYLTAATPELLRILGIHIVEGRGFEPRDEGGPFVMLVNQTMARTVWPGESAVGKCVRIGFDPDFDPEAPSDGPPMPSERVPCREIVGVVKDVRQRSILPGGGEDRLMQYYVPYSQIPRPPFLPGPTPARGLLIRTTADPVTLLASIRRAIVAENDQLPFLRVRRYSELFASQMRPWVVGARLFAVFACAALFIAAAGLYAAFAHAVSERKREMAIRLAIGARPAAVLHLILREATTMAVAGVGVGMLGSIHLSRAIQSLLFETSAADPIVLGGASLTMLIVAVVATLAPAREASRVEPATLLRAE